jgi:peptide subunit release factor RF-3
MKENRRGAKVQSQYSIESPRTQFGSSTTDNSSTNSPPQLSALKHALGIQKQQRKRVHKQWSGQIENIVNSEKLQIDDEVHNESKFHFNSHSFFSHILASNFTNLK